MSSRRKRGRARSAPPEPTRLSMWHGRRPDRTVTGDLIETFRCFGRDGEPVVIRFVAGPAVLARPSLGREVEEAARAIVEIGRSPSVTVHIDGGPSVVYPPAS